MAFDEADVPRSPSYGIDEHELELPDDVSGWIGLGWFMVVALASATVVALALPPEGSEAAEIGDFVRLDWLIVATFLVWPVRHCAQHSIWCGLAAVVVASSQSFYVVSAGLHRLAEAEISVTEGALWYLIPVFQVCCYTGFGLSGARRRWTEWRWQRLVAQLMRDTTADVRRRRA